MPKRCATSEMRNSSDRKGGSVGVDCPLPPNLIHWSIRWAFLIEEHSLSEDLIVSSKNAHRELAAFVPQTLLKSRVENLLRRPGPAV